MEKVLTITLNPAIDKSTVIQTMAPEKKLRCAPPNFEPGGGGVNVSRAIRKLGGTSTALFFAGGHTGSFFLSLLQRESIDAVAIPINAFTRENLIVFEESTGQQYRFGMPGPSVTETDWNAVLHFLSSESGYEYVVISGSNPNGVPPDFYKEAAKIVRNKKAKLVADTSGDTLKTILDCGIFLAKPNLGELAGLVGTEELDAHSAIDAAKSVINNGKCEVLVVSMGAFGALLVTANEVFHSPSPAVKRKSTVGAGDSMVAGLITGFTKGLSLKNVLRYGIASGTAATLNSGTALCNIEDVERIYSQLLMTN
ncbi:MAG TPA: 1-phosphofructokinase family hexose kinase [Panacibacter sp.]|nr:1-phosphofructokinase family hexose kinase [Panacibacter sp.]HNP45024.1 1-phosphofructokinase family hexose kinase [Panacibacter sp.]